MAKEKKPRAKVAKPKPVKVAKAKTPKVKASKFNSPVNEEDRALFLNHLPKISDLKAKLNSANANLRNAYKTAKADGFLKGDFDTAFQIQGADGEKAKKAAIARDLTIAKWLGCDLGAQLDLFVEPERVPAVDRAFEEGKVDAMSNKAAKPSYDPSTPQHAKYMEGYHSISEARIKGGIGKLHPAVAEDLKETAAKAAKVDGQKAQDAKAFDKPASGVAMTREEYQRQQQAAASDKFN
jgi:hypothetical protein